MHRVFKFSLFLIFGITLIDALEITAKYGRLNIDSFIKFAFNHENNTYFYKAFDKNFTTENEILLGYIKYTCDNNTRGYLLSHYECEPSYFYSKYNDLSPKCKQIWVRLMVMLIF